MGLDARRGDILDIGRVDRYCTLRRNIAHRAQVSAVHKPCKVARVPPQPPWRRANPITTELLWPVVLSTQPGQPGWAPWMGLSILDVGTARSSKHPKVRWGQPYSRHCARWRRPGRTCCLAQSPVLSNESAAVRWAANPASPRPGDHSRIATQAAGHSRAEPRQLSCSMCQAKGTWILPDIQCTSYSSLPCKVTFWKGGVPAPPTQVDAGGNDQFGTQKPISGWPRPPSPAGASPPRASWTRSRRPHEVAPHPCGQPHSNRAGRRRRPLASRGWPPTFVTSVL